MKVHSKNDNEIFADMIVWYKYFMPQKFGSHVEFDKNPLTTAQIDEIIKDKIAVYDLSVDQRNNKLGGNKLENYPIQNLPKFLIDNLEKYKEWID